MKQFVITDINGQTHMVNGSEWTLYPDKYVIIYDYNRNKKAMYFVDKIVGFEIRG